MRVDREVLSEAFQKRMQGRRLRAGVFLTFSFDPGFFEQEILPVFFDVPLSHAAPVRLMQLEETLRGLDDFAVYYDHRAIVAGALSARLDISRIPVVQSGFFHPKNVLLLAEEDGAAVLDSGQGGARVSGAEVLLVGTLSANLTQSGWWDNVEVCHIEEVRRGDSFSFRDDLLRLMSRIRRGTPPDQKHDALDRVHAFVRDCQQFAHATRTGRLRERLYTGPEPVPDFLDAAAGDRLSGLNLEVVSPYFDEADAGPLRLLIERFEPREVRVFLPRTQSGAALCSSRYYDVVADLPGVQWAKLPAEITRRSASKDGSHRNVHAKIYRFFGTRPVCEFVFVGSVNLTSAAHSRGGNLETAFLLETENPRKLDWWLEVGPTRPAEFEPREEAEARQASTRLQLRFDWRTKRAQAMWAAGDASPELVVTANGEPVMELRSLPGSEWIELTLEQAQRLEEVLQSISILTVTAPGEGEASILVQEERMAKKPSLLMTLSVEDILRYWSLLTPEQKTAFLETRLPDLAASGLRPPPPPKSVAPPSIFSTFAGIFHAFSSLQTAVETAIDEGRTKEAEYRLFGEKFDSLTSLVRNLAKPAVNGADETGGPAARADPVTRYVTAMSAKQLVRHFETNHAAFRKTHASEFNALRREITTALRTRHEIEIDKGKREFLKWFDRWFLRVVEPVEESSP